MSQTENKQIDYDKCCFCGSFHIRRAPKYDAYYCVACWKWIEPKCLNDTCAFCTTRPDDAGAEVAGV